MLKKKKVNITVNPKVLLFARKTAGFSVEKIVKKLKRVSIDVKIIGIWEKKSSQISLSVLKDIAKHYKRPLTFFFLKIPPNEPIIPTDFRTLPSDKKSLIQKINLPPDAMTCLRRARRSQKIAYEISLKLKKKIKKELLQIKLTDDPILLAKKIREKLALKIEEQSKWKEPNEALKKWIGIIESQGIIVQQNSIKIREETFRGFSLTGDSKLLPLIFLSTKDAPNGRIFTLLHEYCHLMLNESGIIISENSVVFNQKIKLIETFCNKFASSLLVPEEILTNHEIVKKTPNNAYSENKLIQLAKYFAVSKEVIVLRLKKLKKVDQKFYENKKIEWSKQNKKIGQPRKHWDTFYLNSNGGITTSLVYESYHKNLINFSELLSTLNFKSNHFEKVENRLNQRSLYSNAG